MEPITWTGSLGPILNPAMLAAVSALIVTSLASVVLSIFSGEDKMIVNADHTLTVVPSPAVWAKRLTLWSLFAVIGLVLAYIVGGILMPAGARAFSAGWRRSCCRSGSRSSSPLPCRSRSSAIWGFTAICSTTPSA
ncbi:MAG: hypothetical protein JKP98_05985 [Rhodobacteraceae bacterium]|nr:hypothetical protein [Paracoccaceae bacterium]